jgi:hypothetical protein
MCYQCPNLHWLIKCAIYEKMYNDSYLSVDVEYPCKQTKKSADEKIVSQQICNISTCAICQLGSKNMSADLQLVSRRAKHIEMCN